MSSAASKIRKAKGAEPDEFELTIAQEIYNLQVSSDMKADLHGLHICAAKEVELAGGRKAIILFVPFKQLKDYHKLQAKLIRELEKKFR
jgi:small subunit ribosomal protein S7e